MTIERRKICVMSFYGKRREWAVYWNRKDVSATVWERVPFCDTKRTAREALALARMSLNDITPFKRNTGRGNAYYTAEQLTDEEREALHAA